MVSMDAGESGFAFENRRCEADAGTLEPEDEECLSGGTARLEADEDDDPEVPDGYKVIYVLTQGSGLVIQAVNDEPKFTVDAAGTYTIHTLVYDPNTLDLGIVQFGSTTGFDVNGLLVQGGGTICGALDVAGAQFTVDDCSCEADAGTLEPEDQDCLGNGTAAIEAEKDDGPEVPDGYEVIYVLTQGSGLVIRDVSDEPEFNVNATGRYTIHTLVYDPNTLDLGIVQFGVTTGFDVNGLLVQGGGTICGALDVTGASFTVEDCGNRFIFPNPAEDQLHIPFSAMFQGHPATIQLFDPFGRIVFEQTLDAANSVERVAIAGLPPGMYNVVTLGTGKVKWRRSELILKK